MNGVAELNGDMSSIMSEVVEMRHEIRSLLMNIYNGLKDIMLLCLGIFLVFLIIVDVFK